MHIMEIVCHHPEAKLPTKSTHGAAGYDLYSVESGAIPPHERRMIDIGIIMRIPYGYYGRIAPRSGLALHHGIHTMAGVIDSDYRGVVKCILYNSGNADYVYSVGNRIAQIIFERCHDFTMVQVSETSRGPCPPMEPLYQITDLLRINRSSSLVEHPMLQLEGNDTLDNTPCPFHEGFGSTGM